MPFTLQHILVSETLQPETQESAQGIYFTVAAQGTFQLLYPGRLQRMLEATVRHSMRVDTPDTTGADPPGGIDTPGHPPPPDPTPQPLHNGVQVTSEGIPLDLRIYDPSGKLFTRDEVTLADLVKFRDLHGRPSGQWRYTLTGRSRLYVPSSALHESVTDPKGAINLSVRETVASSSAPPLVARARLDGSRFSAQFDLYRVGTFIATIVPSHPSDPWHGSMRLIDPDGVRVGSTTSRELRCPIPLLALGKSRDAAGKPRPWTLEVSVSGGTLVGQQTVTATVLGEGRVTTAVLQERIQKLIGRDGSSITLVGENVGGDARVVLTITDLVAAETLDMYKVLDSALTRESQSTDIEVDTPMVLYHIGANWGHDLELDVGTVKLRSINVEIGPGKELGPATPTMRLIVRIDGRVKVKWHGLSLADAGPRGGSLAVEVGIQIDPDGTPRLVHRLPQEPLDIHIDYSVVSALVIFLGPLAAVTAEAIAGWAEKMIGTFVTQSVAGLFDDPSLGPSMLMTIFGAHLSYLPPRFEGSDLLFEHVAPIEPDPKPRENYAGAIGRTVLQQGIGRASFVPPVLGDTWKADNLKGKIDHIVVVMMENRSYDHVLGYRAQAPISDGADGLTGELMAVINAAVTTHDPAERDDPGFERLPPVHPLRKAAFEANALGLKTRIPKSIGHELEDVAQQLRGRIAGPNGRLINDPNGFIDNFRDKELGGNPAGENGCTPFTVLGYYEKVAAQGVDDLPMTAFLAENYAYCDRYYCSHAGPTLPNRMFSVTGDVQHDRFGVPILDNNHGDNFLLSRAPTIYDLLTRKGVSWKVYESSPSVTMLRMFARYATDDVHIRPLDELARDVAAGDLPSLTVVEPAMHHHPEDDDHPDADMYRGQIFLKRVYDALRSKPEVWRKTLLLITYDEHGGLYDHVVPPIADVLNAGRPDLAVGPSTVGGMSGGGATGSAGGSGGTVGGHGPRGGLHASFDHLSVLLGEGTQPTDKTIEIPYGVRVPTLVVSPWATPGKGPSVTLDHCSILKTVLARFCSEDKPFLSDRVRASHSFESYLDAAQPRMDVGAPPVLATLPEDARRTVPGGRVRASAIVTPPLFRKRMRNEKVDYHDVTGRLARMLGR